MKGSECIARGPGSHAAVCFSVIQWMYSSFAAAIVVEGQQSLASKCASIGVTHSEVVLLIGPPDAVVCVASSV
jgi:hypothetical protein